MRNPDAENTKKIWRLRWLEMLFEFSHLEYQKGLWIEKKYENEVGWYSEDMCKYFDDLILDDDYQDQLKDNLISKAEFDAIKDFHFQLKNYNEGDKTDDEILADPFWLKVVELGNKSWKELKKIIQNSEELEHMKGLEEKYILNQNAR